MSILSRSIFHFIVREEVYPVNTSGSEDFTPSNQENGIETVFLGERGQMRPHFLSWDTQHQGHTTRFINKSCLKLRIHFLAFKFKESFQDDIYLTALVHSSILVGLQNIISWGGCLK